MAHECIILRGPSGIGKSTWIRQHYPTATVCSADHYFINELGEYEFDPRCLPIAHSQCLTKFINALTTGDAVVILDNTNTAEWEYINYKTIASAFDYRVTLHEFTVKTIKGLQELIKRQSTGKHVPTDILCRMVLDFEPGSAQRVLYSDIETQILNQSGDKPML